MKKLLFCICLLVCFGITWAQTNPPGRSVLFDAGWRFLLDSSSDLYRVNVDDSKWRELDLPHDWSIEDLPHQIADTIVGPFSRNSIGRSATGFTVGGTGWYRKKFTAEKAGQGKMVSIHFDGVYMNAEVWLNGHHLGNHPYGYTAFYYDLTPFLNPSGQDNVIAVRVQNEGKNSRWYSGSGIYRHVWLSFTDPVHVATWGISITTTSISKTTAILQIKSTINNEQSAQNDINLVTTILSPDGKTSSQNQRILHLEAKSSDLDSQTILIKNPFLWSVETPQLYKLVTEIKAGNKTLDHVETVFGVRTIEFDGQKGFLLNGQVVKLRGGCIHHDNGPLGAASIDRAEERKIELLKKAGYNAIRSSHNPPSEQLLDACDRLGMLVLDEAFDMWGKAKNPEDYHLYFKDWWQRDLDAMILRDRNHPSIIMWSIGNEIYEAPDSLGHQLAKLLADETRRLDPSRPVTEAIVFLPPYTQKPWVDYQRNLANLDVDGYNYFLETKDMFFQRDSATSSRFDSEHAKHPKKTFIVTEYLPSAALENWEKSEKSPYVIGSFKWTAMDYMGESGIGRSLVMDQSKKIPTGLMGIGMFYKETWTLFNAYCGDLDLIGNRKASSYYQDVVWQNRPIEMLVHWPIPEGMKEAIAPWGSPDELKSWTWPAQEGKKMQVNVYTRSNEVKLELNGKEIAAKKVPDHTITAHFEIDYQPGILIAKGFVNGRQICADTLTTAGKPSAVRLTADRKIIKANTNDLSYVNADIVDEKGNIIPWINDLEITYDIKGNASIAGIGSGSPIDMSSFQQNHKKVYQGRGMVIVRPKGAPGKIILKANAQDLAEGSIEIIAK